MLNVNGNDTVEETDKNTLHLSLSKQILSKFLKSGNLNTLSKMLILISLFKLMKFYLYLKK